MALLPRTAAGRAFWLALAFGVLSLVSMPLSPVSGAAGAVVFFVVAFAIRRGGVGPAILMGGFFVLRPLAAVAGTTGDTMWMFLVMLPIPLGIAWFAFAAAWESVRRKRVGTVWPWMAALCLYGLTLVCFGSYQMPSASMENTLLPGDIVLTETASLRLGRVPRNGELVVFRYPVDRKQTFIKRVVGVPGDRLRIVHRKLYRNGQPVDEPYAVHTSSSEDAYRDNFPSEPTQLMAAAQPMLHQAKDGEVIVPEGQYFVMGDNRDDSLDSRYWGFVPRGDIIATPLLIYDSYDTKKEGLRGMGDTRWERVFRRI